MGGGIGGLLHSTSKGSGSPEASGLGVSAPGPVCEQSLWEIWVGLSRLGGTCAAESKVIGCTE